MKSIRVHGGGVDKYENVRLGINGRLDTIQATILLEKIEIFDMELKLRNRAANYYTQNINNLCIPPYIPDKYFSSWAQYSIVLPDSINRYELIEKLNKNEIPSMIYYKIPNHLQEGYRKYGNQLGDFKMSEDISKKILSLPLHPYLDENSQDKVLEVINSFN
tara:strand:- start:1967 stop:2452 length:486 start_codon:yes stop_codon:yes gene_type:complete